MINKIFISKVSLAGVVFLVAFLLMEATLRIMGYHPLFMQMDMFIEQENILLPYTLKPNYEDFQGGKNVQIDSYGQRVVKPGPLFTENRFGSSEAKKILILGDSVVFGFGLRDEETIASQLQQFFNDKGLNYVIKNIGAPGYTSWNEYEALRQYLMKNDVSVVVLVYVHNDITLDNNELVHMQNGHEISRSPFKRFLLENIYTATLIQKIRTIMNERANSENMKSPQGSKIEYEQKLRIEYLNPQSLDYSMEALSKIKSLCEENEIELLVTIVRAHFWHNLYPDFSAELEEELLERLDSLGIRAFIAASHTQNLSNQEINVYRNDAHPSALAVSYIVGDIYNQIMDSGGNL